MIHELSKKAKHTQMILDFVKTRGIFVDLTKNDLLALSPKELKKREMDNIVRDFLELHPDISEELIRNLIEQRYLMENGFDDLYKKYCIKYFPELRNLHFVNLIGDNPMLSVSLLTFFSLAIGWLLGLPNFVTMFMLIVFLIILLTVPLLIRPKINRDLIKNPELYKFFD